MLARCAGFALALAACTEASPPAPVPQAATSTPAKPPASANSQSLNSEASATAAQVEPAPSATAVASAAPSALPQGPHIWGKSRFTWIHPSPFATGGWIGYVGLGGAVALKPGVSAQPASGAGCNTWYAIEPQGYVCAGDIASVDPNETVTAALIRDAGDPTSPWPFEYAESLGTPRYTTIPTVADMLKNEWDLAKHFEKVARARGVKTDDELAAIDKTFIGVDFSYSNTKAPDLPPVSPFVRESRRYVVNGSTISWVRAFDVEFPPNELGIEKRTFLLTSDFALVPKDRVRPYPKSPFKGIVLNDDLKLPIAFFRKTPRPKYKKQDDGTMATTGEFWPAKGYTMVTGEEVTVGKDRYLVTREPGIYAKADDAVIATESKPPSRKILEAVGRGTWLDISVLGGFLIAYEKTKPVFATLISPGRGGIPFPGKDPVSTASTPIGNFRVDGKFLWATMVSSSNSDIVHTDVQYVQNFHGPHALHGAYWHNVFGEPKSGGCINLSPHDSKWVFEFTEPSLPKGWHGMRSANEVYATIVSVRR
ncbi:MAG: L,D-transpeptidase family protein [Polyangiaceae bacterium]|nr:L,D-transpeptidase family protein [Polyangiaceae bacterium]